MFVQTLLFHSSALLFFLNTLSCCSLILSPPPFLLSCFVSGIWQRTGQRRKFTVIPQWVLTAGSRRAACSLLQLWLFPPNSKLPPGIWRFCCLQAPRLSPAPCFSSLLVIWFSDYFWVRHSLHLLWRVSSEWLCGLAELGASKEAVVKLPVISEWHSGHLSVFKNMWASLSFLHLFKKCIKVLLFQSLWFGKQPPVRLIQGTKGKENLPCLSSSAAGIFFPAGSLNLPIVDSLQVEWEEFSQCRYN